MTRGVVRNGLVAVLLISGASFAVAAKSKHPQIDSVWRTRDIVVDGSESEWPGPLVQFEQQPVSFAAANDRDFLYVVITTSDLEARAQIMREGLIVWFDNAGGDKKRFGIKYPVGMQPGEFGGRGERRGSPRQEPREREPGGDQQGGQRQAPDRWLDQYQPPDRLELLGTKKEDTRSYTLDKAPGIAVKIGSSEGTLAYELKVPLAKNDEHPYAIDAQPGTAIGVGLETPKIERPSGGYGRGGGMGGGMGRRGGGGYGGMGGGGGRGGMGGGFATMRPMKGWIVLKLAAR